MSFRALNKAASSLSTKQRLNTNTTIITRLSSSQSCDCYRYGRNHTSLVLKPFSHHHRSVSVREFSQLSKNLASLQEAIWKLRAPKKGMGFDNFIPKNNKDDNSNENNDSKLGKDGFSFETKGDKKSGGNGGGSNNNNNRWERWFPPAVILFLAFYMLGDQREEALSNSNDKNSGLADREISWFDFLRLLQQNDIVKVVVGEDKQTARVYLQPNAKGLVNSGSNTNSMNTTQAMNHSFTGGGNGDNDSVNAETDGYHNQDQQEMDGLYPATATMASSQGPGGSSVTHHVPFFYRMAIGNITAFEQKLDEAQRALGRHPSQDVSVQYAAENTVGKALASILPSLIMAGALYGMIRYAAGGIGGGGGVGGGGPGGIFQIGKSKAKKVSMQDVDVNFGDVAGCQEAKKEIMEFVDFLKDSDRFTKLGAKIPKGALLCGPPGTGKTLLAKAVAGEAGVPFFSISGSDFIEMFVGVGPSRVRDLFKDARENAPCIIFIDEIDAVGRQRGRGGMGGNDERENTLNQLLVEMDGFSPSTGVVVLAGTNRVDILDQALIRPGRFDRQITVDKPDLKGRKEIFQVHLKGITLEDDSETISGRLAGLTPGFAGADIANICNEAAIQAARRRADTVAMEDFEKATDRIIGGLESNKIMSKEERSIVAHHEAGHAVAGWFLEHADPLLKVTIIPRSSGALGYAQYLPKEVFLRTEEQIMDIVCMTLAGRAAEEIFFGRVTTGASDDLRRVTDLVYSTIQLYGMNSRLGQLSFPKDPNAMWEERPYSEKTAKAMDEEAKTIVDAAYTRTLNLLREKKGELEKVANTLLEKETITHDDVVGLIGERPFKGDAQYDEFIRRSSQTKSDVSKEEEAEAKPAEPLTPGLA